MVGAQRVWLVSGNAEVGSCYGRCCGVHVYIRSQAVRVQGLGTWTWNGYTTNVCCSTGSGVGCSSGMMSASNLTLFAFGEVVGGMIISSLIGVI